MSIQSSEKAEKNIFSRVLEDFGEICTPSFLFSALLVSSSILLSGRANMVLEEPSLSNTSSEEFEDEKSSPPEDPSNDPNRNSEVLTPKEDDGEKTEQEEQSKTITRSFLELRLEESGSKRKLPVEWQSSDEDEPSQHQRGQAPNAPFRKPQKFPLSPGSILRKLKKQAKELNLLGQKSDQ
jgi:hypothetical protein